MKARGARRLLPAVAAAALACAYGAPSASAARYYLALGDSLAAGFEAGPAVAHTGYVERLYTRLRRRQTDLRLVNVACLGTTSQSLQTGDLCTGAQGPQLAQATAFLRAHRGQVSLVTIDIGGNDIGSTCAAPISIACVHATIATMTANLRRTSVDLRRAAGARTPIAAMNYYDPALAGWLRGDALRAQARQSLSVIDELDRGIAAGYTPGRVMVADVTKAFATHDLTRQVALPGHGLVPRAVANICRWTGACETPQDNHGTAAGYRVIADTFWRVITPSLPR